jgi:hypothetical protein
MPIRLAVPLIILAIVTGGCARSSATATPGETATATVQPSAPGSVPPAGGQTDTEWGRIWDTLPSGFPTYPGATPGEETATGPASANLVVDGLDAKGIATLLQTLLTQGGYETTGLQGPLEDGSYVLDMSGPPAGCKLQVTAAPTGGLTTLTILYGAACPHD